MKELIKLKENNINLKQTSEIEYTLIRDKFEDTFNLLNYFSDVPNDIKQSIYENLKQALEVYEKLNDISFEINALKLNTMVLDALITSANSK